MLKLATTLCALLLLCAAGSAQAQTAKASVKVKLALGTTIGGGADPATRIFAMRITTKDLVNSVPRNPGDKASLAIFRDVADGDSSVTDARTMVVLNGTPVSSAFTASSVAGFDADTREQIFREGDLVSQKSLQTSAINLTIADLQFGPPFTGTVVRANEANAKRKNGDAPLLFSKRVDSIAGRVTVPFGDRSTGVLAGLISAGSEKIAE